MSKFNLQAAFARSRAPCENIEDQLSAIQNLTACQLFEITSLRRRKLVVED